MRKNKKGFTLAELLIVVAIIAVLVAIAIPVFQNNLEKANEATDAANLRAAYAIAAAASLDQDGISVQVGPITLKNKDTYNRIDSYTSIGNYLLYGKSLGKSTYLQFTGAGSVGMNSASQAGYSNKALQG